MILSISCVQKSKHQEVLNQRDSLLSRNAQNEAMMAELQNYLDEITMSLDSIAYQESILFLPDPEMPEKEISKTLIKERLEAFQELVDRQQARVQLLEDSLDFTNTNFLSIKSLLGHMQGQIDIKNTQIEQMRVELQAKDADIKSLKGTVKSLSHNVNNLKEQTRSQKEALAFQEEVLTFQDEMLNEAYFLMGSKKELISWGAMQNGKVTSNPPLENFIKVDIRYFTELEIPSSRPKIITAMPENAYSLIKNGDGTSTLSISKPSEFWKASKILIIQLR